MFWLLALSEKYQLRRVVNRFMEIDLSLKALVFSFFDFQVVLKVMKKVSATITESYCNILESTKLKIIFFKFLL